MAIQYPMPQNVQPLPGMLDPITIRQFRGVNTYDPLMIEDTFLTDMSNMCSDDYPALSVRPGYSVIGSAGTKVLGMGAWKSELHVVFNDGTWQKWNGTAWTTLLTGLSAALEWSFTVFQGNLDDINLIGANGAVTKRYDGTTVSDLTGAPAGGKYITTYQNRLWCAVGKELHACALDQPTEWSLFEGTEQDSYVKDMESSRGEDINFLSGSLVKLTIGMKNSLHELHGELPSSFTVKMITDDVGLLNNKSGTTQDGVMRIIDDRAIYDYAGGSQPDQEFSEVVGGFLSNIDANGSAGADNNNLYFRTNANSIMVYDSRSGVNSWSIWNSFDPAFFLLLDYQLFIGDNSGRVLKMGGSTDGGTAISWRAVTKPFTNPSMAQKMRWLKMFVVVELAIGSTLSVSLSKSIEGDSDWEVVKNITGDGNTKAQRILIPVAKYALENAIRIKFSGTGYAKIHEHTRHQRMLPLY